ncbi:MAG: transcriptional regulator, GntR family [Acidimicrobiales bacterium]|nr:transcriptional regulator, GntR family [Acidimicrobiales bacterium]
MSEATEPRRTPPRALPAPRFPSPTVRRTSSAERVATAIRRGILTGQLARGDRLTQDEIAEQLGMSRIPVREAMIALDREGWVRSESSRGVHVTGLEADDVRDHYELRGLVLGAVAERATGAITADALHELVDLEAALRQAPSTEAFSALNDSLLRKIVRAAGSSRFAAALRVTPSIVPDDFFTYVPGARSIQEHGLAKVLAAVLASDPAGAGTAMRTLLQRQGAAVTEVFDERGLMNDRATPVEVWWPGGEPATSADAVAAHVRQLIFEGALEPGQRLPQDDIAGAVGVSRIPVREAIIALEREGWVRVEPHRGAYVNALDGAVVHDHFTLYGLYFGFAARRAIERMTPSTSAELAVLAADVASARTARAMAPANARYLRSLLATAASNRVAVVLRSMTPLVPGQFFTTVPGSVKVQRAGIPALQEAVGAGDPDAAAARALELQLQQATAVAKVVRRRRVGP